MHTVCLNTRRNLWLKTEAYEVGVFNFVGYCRWMSKWSLALQSGMLLSSHSQGSSNQAPLCRLGGNVSHGNLWFGRWFAGVTGAALGLKKSIEYWLVNDFGKRKSKAQLVQWSARFFNGIFQKKCGLLVQKTFEVDDSTTKTCDVGIPFPQRPHCT